MGASSTPTLKNGVQALFPSTHQKVAYTGTAGTISNTVKSSIIRVITTSAAYIAISDAPTATTSDVYMAAGAGEYFRCTPGNKVSAIQDSANGTLHVTEMD
ncbi:hypothetical protein UFOVP1528_33 [uncultured Caudovirales phage]|uniref:Uncharacterized protein n=1 Tax=uncultured Caudovirales phage TaxID=2100421 RepID=A0A6J5PRK8_9CAUD|nr:hypothetical protein UFOVP905_42 [uncultured Caudovirales phage]CAB4182962.1 hypothetical protein UFOVP1080_30 [uncultured Caudovirales phage]CAB4197375.1 hypothetical protein UFOVP1321_18 [uncultured Caudovirales phage]CAB4212881.1 hypothetical protein UFOVP1432_45 [uncultured Caudovirales phage]CAB5227386.1 hypothetical protein UFOVP1528_33 [uncultured Caudovirales phage]